MKNIKSKAQNLQLIKEMEVTPTSVTRWVKEGKIVDRSELKEI